MKEFTDTEIMNWVECQTNGEGWIAGHFIGGGGFRLHNLDSGDCSIHSTPSAREAISRAMNKELDGLSIVL